MTTIPNEPERKAVIDAVLNLFGASKTESFLLPIPDTGTQLYVVAGDMEEIQALVALSTSPLLDKNDQAEGEKGIRSTVEACLQRLEELERPQNDRTE